MTISTRTCTYAYFGRAAVAARHLVTGTSLADYVGLSVTETGEALVLTVDSSYASTGERLLLDWLRALSEYGSLVSRTAVWLDDDNARVLIEALAGLLDVDAPLVPTLAERWSS